MVEGKGAVAGVGGARVVVVEAEAGKVVEAWVEAWMEEEAVGEQAVVDMEEEERVGVGRAEAALVVGVKAGVGQVGVGQVEGGTVVVGTVAADLGEEVWAGEARVQLTVEASRVVAVRAAAVWAAVATEVAAPVAVEQAVAAMAVEAWVAAVRAAVRVAVEIRSIQ